VPDEGIGAIQGRRRRRRRRKALKRLRNAGQQGDIHVIFR
jgi:hypothetical protein